MTRTLRIDPALDWVATRYYVRFDRPDGSVAAFALRDKESIDEVLRAGAVLGWEVAELSPPSPLKVPPFSVMPKAPQAAAAAGTVTEKSSSAAASISRLLTVRS